MRRRFWTGILLVVVCLIGLPTVVAAQSQFTGQPKDESGGVLPGVTVKAASPALIEKSKSAVTDSTGRYTLLYLRQGTYEITFTLTGFATVLRDGVELPANFVSTINADIKVCALEDTITVSGQTPLVDVTQASRRGLKGGSSVIASWTTEKNVSVFGASHDDPNGPLVSDLYTGFSASNGGRFVISGNSTFRGLTSSNSPAVIPWRSVWRAARSCRAILGPAGPSRGRCRRTCFRAGAPTRKPLC